MDLQCTTQEQVGPDTAALCADASDPAVRRWFDRQYGELDNDLIRVEDELMRRRLPVSVARIAMRIARFTGGNK